MSSEPRVAPWYRRIPWHVLAFMAPAVIIYTVFMIYPLFDSLRLSLLDQNGLFTGLDNYVRLLTDQNWAPRFFGAVSNNIVFFIIHMIVQNGVGLLLAAILTTRVLRGRTFYRTVIFLPTVLSVVIIGFAWQLILSPLWGIAEGFLGFFGLEDLYLPWLGLNGPALIVLALISVWQFVGIPMLLFSAAFLAISDEVLEASRVDGASSLRVFRSIQLPLIAPTIGIVAVLTFVGNFNAFDLIYTVQGGLAGPDFSTDVMGTFFFRTFFGQQLQLGNPTMGATVAGMMFLIILVGVIVYLFGMQRRLLKAQG
ncbi:MAG: carbohydrate ABC transporter permease [Chloroflexota bacterium]